MHAKDELDPPNLQSAAMPDAEQETDSVLRRWSRRKLASTAEPASDNEDPIEAAAEETEPSADTAADCTAVELPDLDSLNEDSDYSAFLSPEVEASVRRVALRKLFGLPCFAVRDGLDDYDDDFGSFEGLGDIVTHEMKRLAAQELARQQQDDGELNDGLVSNDESMETITSDAAEQQPAAAADKDDSEATTASLAQAKPPSDLAAELASGQKPGQTPSPQPKPDTQPNAPTALV